MIQRTAVVALAAIFFVGILTAAQADVIKTDPPGKRTMNRGKEAHFVQDMVLLTGGGEAILSFTHGCAARECCGMRDRDGAWLSVKFLDSKKDQLFQITNLVEIMEPDSATIVSKQIDISGKVRRVFLANTKFIEPFMASPGKCR